MKDELNEKKKKLVRHLMNKKILLHPDIFYIINQIDNTEKLAALFQETKDMSRHQIEDYFKKKKQGTKEQTQHSDPTYTTKTNNARVDVIFSYKDKPKKRTVQDFVNYFNKRYHTLGNILRARQSLQPTISISRALSKTERENVVLIGIIKDKQVTKRNNILFTLEDPTGEIKVAATASRPELLDEANATVLDEVIGVSGVNGNKIIFAENIYRPDVPPTNKLKTAPDESYALFLSDLHVGSANFLDGKFNKFLGWLNKEAGTEEQKEIVDKIKYLFIVGDLVDGVGVYPNQADELETKDIYAQYAKCAELLKKIPQHIKIILCPGNHDALRLAEPQPELYKDFSQPIWELSNAIIVSNPAWVRIHNSDSFPGFVVSAF